MFIDEAKIFVKAGDGGNGCVSFRREAFVPRGGPDGGNGGKGGDVILQASAQMTTLLDLKYQQHYRVKRGAHGQGSRCFGKDSPDWIIKIPCGTHVRDFLTGDLVADLTVDGQRAIVARGGKGGRGNAVFATPTHRAPRHAEEGRPGEERWLLLELKLIADVGLIGLPNSGKSTLISRISSAHPKIANYPFTTLTPQLGTVDWKDTQYVVADIPGIIEGAHQGKGLGAQFLRHIERTAFLLFLIDVAEGLTEHPEEVFEVLRQELEGYGHSLLEKPMAIAATKIDINGRGLRVKRLARYCKKEGYDLIPISAVTGEGLGELKDYLAGKVISIVRAQPG